jgi:hypothetical protein
MRRIAVLSMVTFLAACGSSSSSSPGTTYLRVANLAPDIQAIDFCIGAVGGALSSPVMAAAGAADGLKYGGTISAANPLSLMMSKYFAYDAGTYNIAVFDKNLPGSSCANPVASLSNLILGANNYYLAAAIGKTGVTGGAHALTIFTDENTPVATKVVIRFVNTGFLQLPGAAAPSPLPAFDIGYQLLGGTYTKIFDNIIYPSYAASSATVDAFGFAQVDPSILTTGTTLYVCPHNAPPASGFCQPVTLPTSSPITGGVIASAFTIGVSTGAPTAGTSLFCGDNATPPIVGYNYSLCLQQ